MWNFLPGRARHPPAAPSEKSSFSAAFPLARRLQRSGRTRKAPKAPTTMDNSLLISLSHQIASYRSMDVIANNLANVSTPAYQREEPTFNEYVANVRPAEGQTGTQTLSFVQDAGIVRDLSEGHLNTTNAPFDMAIHGKGY